MDKLNNIDCRSGKSLIRSVVKLATAIALVLGAICSQLTYAATPPTQPDAVTPDGGRYYGPLLAGLRHGQGKVEWDDGAWYEGGFENGLFSGKGKYRSNSGAVYEGEFKKGQYAGQGVLSYPDGRKYTGQFAEDRYQGKGRFQASEKQFFEGDFDQGEFTGNGVYQNSDGSRHVGSFVKWRPHGVGKFTDSAGNVYEGSFSSGELSGKGRFLSKNGDIYEGEFKNWKFHGPGIYRHINGDVYRGNFTFGAFDGEGSLTYAKPRKDGSRVDSGVWRYGIYQDAAAEKQDLANVETALYGQRKLLDQTLAALASHAPGKINLYLLAVGGDGSQEVFRREAEFVRRQFDREFDTKGRSLLLVNSRNTVAEMPMATLTSIRESLSAIAAKMDKENDILFLFLTSHGSAEHELLLNQNGMNLNNLEAKELGKLLKESGIRWKAVVISACYAGGFIDPIKDENTMVIAAARHDRTSFGCADENDFTYFGRAFFKESLPHSATFGEAFRKAEVLVAKWETEDFKDVANKAKNGSHSEPQLYYPPEIARYLLLWGLQLKAAAEARAANSDARQ